jgi:hypothetical protein
LVCEANGLKNEILIIKIYKNENRILPRPLMDSNTNVYIWNSVLNSIRQT